MPMSPPSPSAAETSGTANVAAGPPGCTHRTNPGRSVTRNPPSPYGTTAHGTRNSSAMPRGGCGSSAVAGVSGAPAPSPPATASANITPPGTLDWVGANTTRAAFLAAYTATVTAATVN